MKKVHSLVFAALTLPLILAACGSATSTPAASSELVSLTLNSGLSAVKAQGLPSTGAASAVTFIKVNVRDSNGNLVSFDGNNVYKPGGAQTFITLTNSTPTAKVLLPKGTYSFESVGKDNQNGTFLAYGMDSNKDLSAQNPSVTLGLHTLMNQMNSSLVSKLPVNFVNTTDKLDLRLAVKAPIAGLNVPMSDYTVSYSSTDMSVLNSSKLGANVQVNGTANQSSVGVMAMVNGWVATGPETASLQDQIVSYMVPLSSTGLNTDATPPSVTMAGVPGSTNTVMTLSGTASDDKAVAKLQVFDGSVLIGSSNSADGVALINFTGSNWSFGWTSGSVAPDLSVVATDAAGNETRATPSALAVQDYDLLMDYNQYGSYASTFITIPAYGEVWIKVNTQGWPGTHYQYAYDSSGSVAGLTATVGLTHGSQSPMNNHGDYFEVMGNLRGASSSYYIHITNSSGMARNLNVQTYTWSS